jgi:hypothetical protein
MDRGNIEEILKGIGGEDIPAEVRNISEETSESFTRALKFLRSRHSRYIVAFEWLVGSFRRFAVGAVVAAVILAFVVGVGLGRWSKSRTVTDMPESLMISPGPTVKWPSYAVDDSGEGFWRAKAVALLQSKPYRKDINYTRKEGFWDVYTKYLRKKDYE